MSKDKEKYYWLIPEKVIEVLPSIHQNPPDIVGFKVYYLKEILSIISIHSRKEKDGQLYSPLNSTILRKYVPNAEKYMTYLREEGIIERSSGYKKNESSYKYRYTSYYSSKFKHILMDSPNLKLRISEIQKNLKKRNSKKYPIQNKYIRNMTIEFNEAMDFIEKHYSTEEKKYNYAKACIVRIENRDLYVKVNRTNNRLDSNLTNLPSVLRQFIRIYGKAIEGVDVSNSQPYESTMIFTDPDKIKHFYQGKFPIDEIKALRLSEKEDVNKYISLVNNGKFYQYLWNKFEANGLHFESLEKVKLKALIILFDRNNHCSKARKIFEDEFPNVGKAFALIRAKRYNKFAILLQRVESHLILDVIVKRLNEEYPDLVTVTIHDSIYTTKETTKNGKEIIHRVMTEELEKFVGFPPNLK